MRQIIKISFIFSILALTQGCCPDIDALNQQLQQQVRQATNYRIKMQQARNQNKELKEKINKLEEQANQKKSNLNKMFN